MCPNVDLRRLLSNHSVGFFSFSVCMGSMPDAEARGKGACLFLSLSTMFFETVYFTKLVACHGWIGAPGTHLSQVPNSVVTVVHNHTQTYMGSGIPAQVLLFHSKH